MNRFEIGKSPLRANAGYPPFEAPAKVTMSAAVQPKGMVEKWNCGE